MSDTPTHYSLANLKRWGEALDAEHPNGMGASLLGYAETWSKQLEHVNRELQEARKDAERLDWIEAHKMSTGHAGTPNTETDIDSFEINVPGTCSTLRAAIDCAIRGDCRAAIDAAMSPPAEPPAV